MGNINMVCISGNLTADCQKKKAGDTPLVEFTVACNEFRKDAEQYVNFIDCTLFGKRAQGLADYLVKGQKVAIKGKLHHSRWETEDGQKRSKLTFGTDVSGVFADASPNLESVETFSEDANLVELYFPSQTGRLLVPITRTVFSDADPTTAMLELAKGPKDDSGLERALPENCGIKNVTMKDGLVTVDFTKEFAQALEGSDGGQQCSLVSGNLGNNRCGSNRMKRSSTAWRRVRRKSASTG